MISSSESASQTNLRLYLEERIALKNELRLWKDTGKIQDRLLNIGRDRMQEIIKQRQANRFLSKMLAGFMLNHSIE
ncbi:Oidioi.mRNA.OKI2018_I69.PAR.g9394.t1.cds [Oikopleura dioica]|uniref:Oidioi.mRNA.OKI2018_I69.PAR.g9394.t1.cds n=1 Tax=Oikopleura dioica TaxID=34765 RepID=A0ABN7RPG0_OIKDI|nr:Oidioi.mRNA.OKI2018_I69.PAR.g9394.t1.cds [Oikopleura dioica]